MAIGIQKSNDTRKRVLTVVLACVECGPTMRFKVVLKPDGSVEYECDNPRDAVELGRLVSANGSLALQPRRPGRPPKNGRPEREIKAHTEIRSTLRFLLAVKDAGKFGLNGNETVAAMSLAGLRGIGGALIRVRRVLGEQGFAESEAFRKSGTPGKRRWKPGPRLSVAIAKLEELSEGGDEA